MDWLLTLPAGVHLEHLLAFLGAALVAAFATRLVRVVAPKLDFVSRPKGDRWSTAPIPMGGGVALFLTIAPGLWLLSPDLLLGTALVHLLGLVDDRKALRPLSKLVVQLVAAAIVVWGPLAQVGVGSKAGVALLPLGPPVVAMVATALLHVFIANSVNLLDNMDGSAAGVTGVSAAVLYLIATGGASPDPLLGAGAAILCGATAGFLVHNFPPARIFMGDAGSLLLGFVLAGLAVRLPAGGGGVVGHLLMVTFVLGAPLFDTALVWVTRKNARRPFLLGGRDHSTHRLMALGLSPRRTLFVLYGVTAMLGGIALAVGRGDVGTAVLCAVGGGVVVVLLGVFLGDVPVYKAADGQPLSPRIRSAAALYAVELGVDVALLSAAWLAAYAIRFGEAHQAFYLKSSALPALPVVVLSKVGALLVGGLYRGFWRSIRLRDVLAIARALALGSLITVVTATFVFRFENFSRGVVVIDALLGFGAVVGSRAGLRLFRDALERLVGRARRAAVVGPDALQPLLAAGLAGEQHRYELVGTLSPGTTDELLAKARELTVETLLVAADLDEAQATALQAAGLEVRRVRVTID